MTMQTNSLTQLERIQKRAFDVTLLVILALPLVLVITILLGLTILKMGFPMLYWQTRLGRKSKRFDIPKIRTIEVKNDKEYITPFGRFLRVTGLNELPQAYSILRGQMSFVGPRPTYIKEEKEIRKNLSNWEYRLVIKPGLFDPLKSHGISNTENPRTALKYYSWYMNNWSVLVDIKVIFQHTVLQIKKSYNHLKNGT